MNVPEFLNGLQEIIQRYDAVPEDVQIKGIDGNEDLCNISVGYERDAAGKLLSIILEPADDRPQEEPTEEDLIDRTPPNAVDVMPEEEEEMPKQIIVCIFSTPFSTVHSREEKVDADLPLAEAIRYAKSLAAQHLLSLYDDLLPEELHFEKAFGPYRNLYD